MSDEDRDPTQEPPTDEPAVTAEPEGQEATETEPDAATAEGPGAGEAWNDVLSSVGQLGDAITKWAKTAADDPENRRRLGEVRAGMDDMARQAQETFEGIDETEFGRRVRQGADQTGRVVGDAAQRVSDAAAPHVAVIFAGLADAFGQAAASVDESAKRRAERPAEPEQDAETPAAEVVDGEATEE
jgi:hypothetical protein